ncbi:hypothetical protein BIW11_01162 [Tropilaelaps mercedesae]|uniref:Uncharacterized protein n=1 Tax=Tropilaelaps mercedesae TaxID=418985 RepID=A0A1V9XIF1_9ACAR|nr:hypothetical protein BIW11_01162 [Tropilaelaps mercedesae]
MPGVELRYSATYESPYREDTSTPLQSQQTSLSAGEDNSKPVVTIRGYDDRDAENGSTSRPPVEDYRLAGDEYDSAGGLGGVSSSSGSGSEGADSPPSPPTPLIKTLASPASKPLPVDPLRFVKAPLPTLCKQVPATQDNDL